MTALRAHPPGNPAPWAEIVPNMPSMTTDELDALPEDGWTYELVQGVLVRMPLSSGKASHIGMRLASRLSTYAEDNGLGAVTGEQGGYRLDPAHPRDTEVAPDVAFVRADRLPPPDSREYDEAWLLAPDLAVAVLREKHDVVAAFFHGLAYHGWRGRAPAAQVQLLQQGVGAVCGDDETKSRFLQAGTELSQAFALVNPRPEADALRDNVVFFQAVRRSVVKYTVPVGQASAAVEAAVKQLVSEDVSSHEVVDIFAVAGTEQPDVSILSDRFLADVWGLAQPNVQFEVLRKLLDDEITSKMRRNVVTYRSFKQRLEESIRAYLSRSVQSAEVIATLVQMALELRGVENRAASLGLSDEEVAFYDVLARGGEEGVAASDTLRPLVRELVGAIKGNVGIDWTDHESMRAKVRVAVKRVLRRSGMTPAEIEALLPTVMEQARNLYRDWPMAA